MAANIARFLLLERTSSATGQPTSAQPKSYKPVLRLIHDLMRIWEFSNGRLAALLQSIDHPDTRLEAITAAVENALNELTEQFNDFHPKYNTTARTLGGYEQALMTVMLNVVTQQICADWRLPPSLEKEMGLPPTHGLPESPDLDEKEGIMLRGAGRGVGSAFVVPFTCTFAPRNEEELQAWRDIMGEEDTEGGWQIGRILQALRESARGRAAAPENVAKRESGRLLKRSRSQ